jgi:hypothetical protein
MIAVPPGDLNWLLGHLVTTVDRARLLVKRVGRHLVAIPRFAVRNAALG